MKNKITSAKVQVGSGHLELMSGRSGPVTWEIDVLDSHHTAHGHLIGEKSLLKAAVKAKMAKLKVAPATSVAIAIDSCRGDKASFTGLLMSDLPLSARIEAQMISGFEPTDGGTQVVIKVVDYQGQGHEIIVPIAIIRDSIPLLQKIAAGDPSILELGRMVEEWRTGLVVKYPLVHLQLNDDVPYALTLQTARDLAADIIERASEIESRFATVN